MEEESIQLIEGVLDDVRPPTLGFKVIKETKDYKEYRIETKKYLKEKRGDNPFTNYLDSFIFCDEMMKIKVPKKSYMIKNDKKKFAYAVGMFPNPKNGKAAYLDGCILAALGLKRQGTNADVICFITHDIKKKDKEKLEVVFDKVIYVPYISPYDMGGEGDLKTIMMDPEIFKNCPNYTKNHPYVHVFFKLHIFNPDLFPYEKVCFVDSDLVPLNYYDSLFMLDTPAGFVEYRKRIPYLESYNWDRCDFLTHGEVIPKELTDIDKKTGSDVNAGLLVVKPDKKEYNAMIKEITSPAKNWIGPNKLHKGFYTFDFSEPSGRSFIKDSYCYPEQNYLTKRFSGKWKFIEFAFQSWSRDPCNSFGIHMAAFNPKPWFKQPVGTKVSIDKKFNPYLKEWDIKKVRIPIAIKENTKSSYENISYSYEIFNEVIVWGLVNYPELKDFFGHDIQIFGTKVSFDRDVFKDVKKGEKFKYIKDVKKGDGVYNKMSKSQKQIADLINDYDKNKKKIEGKYLQICRGRLKDYKGEFSYDFKILEYPDHLDKAGYEIKKLLKKNQYPLGVNKGKPIKDLDKDFIKKIIKTNVYKNKDIKNKLLEFHGDYIESLKSKSGGGKKKKTVKNRRKTKQRKKTRRTKKRTVQKNRNNNSGCIVYYFTMKGCPYCNDYNPHWNKMTKLFPNLTMKKIERNQNPNLIKKYNIMSYPTLGLTKGSKFMEFSGDREDPNILRSFFLKNGIKTV